MQNKKQFLRNCVGFLFLLFFSFGICSSKPVFAALSYLSETDAFVSDETGYYALLKTESESVKTADWTSITINKPVQLSNLSVSVQKDLYVCFSKEKPDTTQTMKAALKIGKAPYDKLRVMMDFTSVDFTEEESLPEDFEEEEPEEPEEPEDPEEPEEPEDPEEPEEPEEIEYESAVALIDGRQGKDQDTIYKKGEAFFSNTEVFLFSTDQLTWKKGEELNSLFLRQHLLSGATIYIKVIEENCRPTKPIKVKIPKQDKAPSVKLDVNRLSLTLKNGMDFAKKPEKEGYYVKWYSILPYHKEGRYSLENQSVFLTADVIPYDKKDSLDFFTSYKYKCLGVDRLPEEFLEILQESSLTLFVRKSATSKKFASAFAEVQLQPQTNGPNFTKQTEHGLLATSSSCTFTLPAIQNVSSDAAPEKYEMLLVNRNFFDQNLIDWTTAKWKAVKSGTKIDENIKTKYSLIDSKEYEEEKFGQHVYLLVRRKGVNVRNAIVLPSKNTILAVYQENGAFSLYQEMDEIEEIKE